jgi:hypothetical protein
MLQRIKLVVTAIFAALLGYYWHKFLPIILFVVSLIAVSSLYRLLLQVVCTVGKLCNPAMVFANTVGWVFPFVLGLICLVYFFQKLLLPNIHKFGESQYPKTLIDEPSIPDHFKRAFKWYEFLLGIGVLVFILFGFMLAILNNTGNTH